MSLVGLSKYVGDNFEGFEINGKKFSILNKMDVKGGINLKMQGHCVILAHSLTATRSIEIEADRIIVLHSLVEAGKGHFRLSAVKDTSIIGAKLIGGVGSIIAGGNGIYQVPAIARDNAVTINLFQVALRENNMNKFLAALLDTVQAIKYPLGEKEISVEEGLEFLDIKP